MMKRLLFAAAGAAIVTVGMFLGMSEVTKILDQGDMSRYLRVFDVITSREPRRPQLHLPENQPARTAVEVELGRTRIEAAPEFQGEVDAAAPKLDFAVPDAP
jgi:hypothetical protein